MALTRNTLAARVRDGAGKGSARRLRAQGLVPAVVYGRHLRSRSTSRWTRRRSARPSPPRTSSTPSSPSRSTGSATQQVLLKDYQQDPVTREILHADFIDVRENEQVKVKVPLVLIGKAGGRRRGRHPLAEPPRARGLRAARTPSRRRSRRTSRHLKIAQALHINDVKLPEGVPVKTHVNYTIAVVSVPEKEEVAVAPVAAAAAAAAGAARRRARAGAAPAAGEGGRRQGGGRRPRLRQGDDEEVARRGAWFKRGWPERGSAPVAFREAS